MPFEKGDPRINRKGRPLKPENRLARILQVLEDVQFHPAKELIVLYRQTKNEKLKRQILLDLIKYMEGEKKPIADLGAPTTVEDSKKKAETTHELLKKLEAEANIPKEG